MTGGAALEGIVIADFSRVLAGPYATMLLGDLGAEVVKVERPGTGDDTRGWGPPWAHGQATYFSGVNRNKRSEVIDLRTADGVRQARDLVAGADVLVENFRPGTMERLGLGYDSLSAERPGLVYCSISGFGAGPGASLAGYDLLVQAVGGLMSVTGQDPSEPTKVGVALVDVVTGLHASLGILAALRHRDRTGHGQRVEVNLMSSLLSALTNQAVGYLAAGVVPAAMGNRHPSIAPYEVFPTADRPLVIAVGNDRQFRILAQSLRLPEMADDPRFATNAARVEHREDLYAALSSALAGDTADSWFRRLTAAGVPTGPINDIGQAFALGDELGLDPVVEVEDPEHDTVHRQVANPIRFSETPATYRLPPPALGADARGA
jgi:crotonobetainyl-CoA:carnitine CoA-transferase CaiB-like acyl-CoA transferase